MNEHPVPEASFRRPWPGRAVAQAGDLALIVWTRRPRPMLVRLEAGRKWHTHFGIIDHDQLIGRPWGSLGVTHKGETFYLMAPTLEEVLSHTPRRTQIIFPKDIGFILLKLSIGPGTRVIEAGSGSGGLTTAFAFYVGEEGRVFSYERREEMQALARKNLEALGLAHRVTFHLHDIEQGFFEEGVDALFLDVPTPEVYIGHARKALRAGGAFGALVPTANQVTALLRALRAHGFGLVDVCEILLRYYKPIPERLRPTDRMVAHTGYLIFARPLLASDEPLPSGDAMTDLG